MTPTHGALSTLGSAPALVRVSVTADPAAGSPAPTTTAPSPAVSPAPASVGTAAASPGASTATTP